NEATPFSSQVTASPSKMQKRERRRANVSAISGAMGEIVARTAIEPHPLAVLAGNDAKAVVFDLMQPIAAGRQFVGFGGEARRDESGRRFAERPLVVIRRLAQLDSEKPQAELGGDVLRRLPLVGRRPVPEHGRGRNVRKCIFNELNPLRRQLDLLKEYPGDVAGGPRQAGHVAASGEDCGVPETVPTRSIFLAGCCALAPSRHAPTPPPRT